MTEKIINNILRRIDKSEDIYDARRAVYNEFLDTEVKLKKNIPIKILILCIPCHGFGDIIFGSKIKRYIKEWYGIDAKIATTTPELFEKVGEPKKNIITLGGIRGKQCRRLSRLEGKIGKYDLIFVAPLMADSKISFQDVKQLIPYSTRSNTFFFSEYNDDLEKGFDVNTGIGKGRDGLLFTKTKCSKSHIEKFLLDNEYALGYIAETIDDSDLCILRFARMVIRKYPKVRQIICPPWVKDIDHDLVVQYVNADNIYITTTEGTNAIKEEDDEGKTIVFRCDIFPVANEIMLSLIHYSVRDVLLTGDQSITDALSCCSDKNIFYQIAPWKEDFGKNLAKYMPNKYLTKISTSCGTLSALNYKSNYKKFVKDWDFRKLGKVKVDAMIASALFFKHNKDIQDIIDNSKTVDSVIHKFDQITKSYTR